MRKCLWATGWLWLCLWLPLAAQPGETALFSLHTGGELKGVLQALSEEFALTFAYETELIARKKVPPGRYEGPSLEALLRQIFLPLRLHFQLRPDQQVLLRPAPVNQPIPEENPWLSLEGKVCASGSRQGLPQVAIYLPQLKLGTYSDSSGSYHLQLPATAREWQVMVHALGYQDLELPLSALLTDGNLWLQRKTLELSPIEIVDRPAALTLSPQHGIAALRAPLVGVFPLGTDPLRAMQLLPGVGNHDDRQAGLTIRGSDPSETLLVLDGLPIYQAGHYFGIFSEINPHFLTQARLYKNVLPIEYGGKTGGLIEMDGPQAVPDFGGNLAVDGLTSSLRLDLPLAGESGVVLQGRTSYANAAQPFLFDWEDTAPLVALPDVEAETRRALVETAPRLHFYDLNAKGIFQPAPAHRVELSFFLSRDQFTNRYQAQYRTNLRRATVLNRELYTHLENWGNTGISLQHAWQLQPRLKLRTQAFFTQHERERLIESSLSQTVLNRSRLLRLQNRQANALTDRGLNGELTYEPAEGIRWQGGLSVLHHDNAYLAATRDRDLLAGEATAWERVAYGQFARSWGPWDLETGLRLTHYSLSGQAYLSPRFRLSRKWGSQASLKVAFSQDNQFVRQLAHESPLGQPTELLILAGADSFPTGRVRQLMLGGTWQQGPWLVDAEAYYRQLGRVMENALLVPGLNPDGTFCAACAYQTFVGDGEAVGLDLLVKLDTRSYLGWVSYSLGKTTHRFDEILGGAAFPGPQDRRHQLASVNTWRLGPWEASLNYTFATGQPYTDFSRLTQRRRRDELSPEARIQRLPDYHRLDLDLAWQYRWRRFQGEIGASVFNLTDHTNVDFVQYTYALPSQASPAPPRVLGTQTNLLPRTFNVRVEVGW